MEQRSLILRRSNCPTTRISLGCHGQKTRENRPMVGLAGGINRAYFDAARRLKGMDIPMLVPSESRGFLNTLFGRKAA
jgi:hypothetical protein